MPSVRDAGAVVCSAHGGRAPAVWRKAAERVLRQRAEREAGRLMARRGEDEHPFVHLLDELHRSSAIVDVLARTSPTNSTLTTG